MSGPRIRRRCSVKHAILKLGSFPRETTHDVCVRDEFQRPPEECASRKHEQHSRRDAMTRPRLAPASPQPQPRHPARQGYPPLRSS